MDALDVSYVQEPNNMVSDPSSRSEDDNSVSSRNREGNCEEHCRPSKTKKKRRKISRIVRYVIGFSFVKNIKMNKRSQKQRSNNDDNNDKAPPKPTTILSPDSHHSSHHYQYEYSKPNAANESPYQSLKGASPLLQYNSTSSSPGYNSATSTLELNTVEPKEDLAMATSPSTKRSFGLVGMHQVMLVISLAALVLSGKACAILCTIVWLILIPLTSQFSNGSRRTWAHLGRKDRRALFVRKCMARF